MYCKIQFFKHILVWQYTVKKMLLIDQRVWPLHCTVLSALKGDGKPVCSWSIKVCSSGWITFTALLIRRPTSLPTAHPYTSSLKSIWPLKTNWDKPWCFVFHLDGILQTLDTVNGKEIERPGLCRKWHPIPHIVLWTLVKSSTLYKEQCTILDATLDWVWAAAEHKWEFIVHSCIGVLSDCTADQTTQTHLTAVRLTCFSFGHYSWRFQTVWGKESLGCVCVGVCVGVCKNMIVPVTKSLSLALCPSTCPLFGLAGDSNSFSWVLWLEGLWCLYETLAPLTVLLAS